MLLGALIACNVAFGANPWRFCRDWFIHFLGGRPAARQEVVQPPPQVSAAEPLPFAEPVPVPESVPAAPKIRQPAGPPPPYLSKKQRLAQPDQPYSVAWMLAHPADKSLPKRVVTQMLEEFQSIVSSPENPKQLAARLDGWIESETHALYVVQSLREFGDRAMPVLQELVASNPYFKDVHAVNGGKGYLVTSSFDIEDPGEGLTLLYRPRHIPEPEWLETPLDRRKEMLFGFKDDLVPTALRPTYLGKPSMEYSTERLPIPEVKHHSFEVKLDNTLAQVKEVASLKGNTHSIHVHLNAEFPEEYAHLNGMHAWHHQRNAYLTFRGLEEGLLPARSISVSAGGMGRVGTWERMVIKTTSLGLRTNQGDHNHGIFGDALQPGHIKVDLELRDTTRDLNRLATYARTIAGELQTRPWEKTKLEPDGMIDLSGAQSPEFAQSALLRAGIPEDVARTIAYHYPLAALPFLNYEATRFFDFAAGKWRAKLKPFEEARLRTTRDAYVARLKLLEAEIRGISTKPQHEKMAYHEAMGLAVGEDLMIWAREAKISELFPDHALHR